MFYQIPIYVFKNFLRSTLSKAMFSILHYKTRDMCLFWDHPFTIFRKTDISYPLIRTHKKCQFFGQFCVRNKWMISYLSNSEDNHKCTKLLL